MKFRVLVVSALLYLLVSISPAFAFEPGWSGAMLPWGQGHRQIQSTPILCRPYRPFHVYGNSVRRAYYRGNPLPQPRDFHQATAALLRAH